MVSQKNTELDENTAPVSTDLVYMVTDPGGTPVSEKATYANATKALAQATETAQGVAELATQAEAEAGTDDTVIMTPLGVQQKIDNSEFTGTSAQFGVFNGSNVFTAVALSSDGSLSNAGALTIAADAITYDKMQDTSGTDIVLGRSTAGAGTVEEITMTSAGRALVDDANAAAQRTTLTAAARSQTFDIQILGLDISGGVALYIIHDDAIFGYEIDSLQACVTDTGTATVALKINSTTVTGISVSATTTKQTTADPSTAASTVAATDEVGIDITAHSTATTLSCVIHCTRTFA